MSQLRDGLSREVASIVDETMKEIWVSEGYDHAQVDRQNLRNRVTKTIHSAIEAILHTGELSSEAYEAARSIGRERALFGFPIHAVLQGWSTAERICVRHLLALPGSSTQVTKDGVTLINQAFSAQMRACTDEYTRTINEVTFHYDRVAADLVNRALGVQVTSSDALISQADSIGVSVEHLYAVIVVAEPSLGNLVRIERLVLSKIGKCSQDRILVGRLNDDIVILCPVLEDDIPWLRSSLKSAVDEPSFPRDENSLVLGISDKAQPLYDMKRLFTSVKEATKVASSLGMHNRVISPGDLTVDIILHSNADSARALMSAISPLLDKPELIDTLEHFYRSGMSIRATSRAMYLHHNTVSHRLKVVDATLGRPSNDVWKALDVILAIKMHRSIKTETET